MIVTEADVYNSFGSTMTRELYYMILGDIIGAGEFRIVYEHAHRDDLVLKWEPHSQAFQNIVEWRFWEDNKDNNRVAAWLAPCEFISSCGLILAQKKTTPAPKADYPKMIPHFLTDLKLQNFGMLNGKLVAHDYGLYNAKALTRRKKADWWDDPPPKT